MQEKEQKQWFEEWFDSPYYHILYKNRDMIEAHLFVDRLSDSLHIQPGQKVLDIPCGLGRHSVFLNEKGYDVTGADLSVHSIGMARKYSNPWLRFLVHDMREPVAEETFDYVMNLFTSFGYFEDDAEDQKVIDAFVKALKPGGRLVVDFMNTTEILNNLVPEEQKQEQGIDFCIHRNLQNRILVKDIKFSDNGKNYHFQEKVKTLTEKDFRKFFEKAGLEIESVFGDYNLNPYQSETSERMIFILKKTK